MQFGAEHDVHLQLSLAFFSTDVYSAGFAFYFPYFASKSHLASVASRLSGGVRRGIGGAGPSAFGFRGRAAAPHFFRSVNNVILNTLRPVLRALSRP